MPKIVNYKVYNGGKRDMLSLKVMALKQQRS